MPAALADIAAGSRDAVTVTWSSPTIAARYPSARDGAAQPSDGYFDTAADAQAVAAARGALIGVDGRRRFTVSVDEVRWSDPAAFLAARLVDEEHGVDRATFDARVEVDLDAETTTYELFG